MKRMLNDPVEEVRQIRRRMWRWLSKLPEKQQLAEINQMAREVQEKAGVKLKTATLRTATVRPVRLHQLRRSG